MKIMRCNSIAEKALEIMLNIEEIIKKFSESSMILATKNIWEAGGVNNWSNMQFYYLQRDLNI